MLARIDFEGYQRRLNATDYRKRRRDMPSDIAELMGIVRAYESADNKEYLDSDYYQR